MNFFEIHLPALPSDKMIYLLETTPMLRRAKLCFVAVLFITLLSVAEIYMATLLTWDDTQNMRIIEIVGVCMQFVTGILYLFGSFFLSKLSLRDRVFNLAAVSLVINIVYTLLTKIDLIALGESLLSIVFVVLMFYIVWETCKELSFITDEPYFFKSAKYMLVAVIVCAISAPCFVIHNIFGALVLCAGALLLLLALVLYVIAIFKIRLVIEYGKSAINPL